MTHFPPTETDDPDFCALVSNIAKGLCAPGGVRELHVVHLDNWFDHKWLHFSGKVLGALGIWKCGEETTVPSFNPKRVVSHRFLKPAGDDGDGDELIESKPPVTLHVNIHSAENTGRRMSDVAGQAGALWYSGKTATNRRGAIMAYLPAPHGYDAWYASLEASPEWKILRVSNTLESSFAELAGLPVKARFDGI